MRSSRPFVDARIRALHAALAQHRPRRIESETPLAHASVALLVRPTAQEVEILVIQRSLSERDPWSGHMALPGGRREAGEDALTTAIRETEEEVGIDLRHEGLLLGRLDEVRPERGGPSIAVTPFVFCVPSGIEPHPNPAEVSRALWIPLSHLADPAAIGEHLHPMPGGEPLRFPALLYRDSIIWGLTHRMLTQFLEIVRAVRQEASS